MQIEFLLNGRAVGADGVGAQTTLLEFLRARGFTGAKEGCAEGECGACAVVMVRSKDGAGSAYIPVNSCLLFLPMAAGKEIYTVEALADGARLAGVQQAMVDCGGSQCGYCTPGFVISMFAEQYRPGRSGDCDIHALSGNLCRCTGYRPIAEAAGSLPAAPDDAWRARLERPAPPVAPGEYAGFSRPGTLAECFARMREHPEAQLIAGGTDLAVESNLRLSRFGWLIGLEALEELRIARESETEIEIGAGLTLGELERGSPLSPWSWFQEWLALFASPLIRNQATLGGSLATASPIGDAAPLLLALEARVRIARDGGERTVPLDQFFVGYRKTVLEAGEVLVSVILPKPLPQSVRFYKAAKRRMDDISTVAAAFSMDLDGRHVRRVRLAYGGVAALPLRATSAEDAIAGMRWDEAAVERAQTVLARTLRPMSDHRGSAAYRLALAQSLFAKFYWEQPMEVAA